MKSFPLTHQRAENGCVDFNEETLEPTYHLRIGEAGMSNAISIAKRLGMPKRLINAARNNLSKKARALRAALEGAAGVKRQAEHARTAAETARIDADKALNEAADARASYEEKKANFQKWVQRVVHLQPGDPVRVRNFDRDGQVIRMRIDQHRAEVDVGSFSVEVPLGDILPPETPPPPPRPEPKPAAVPAKAKTGRAAQKSREPKRPAGESRHGKPQRREERKSPPQAKRQYSPLSAARIEALEPDDKIIVKRLHREGRVVRVEPAKHQVIVSVGVFEVEVPYDGLALSEVQQAPRPNKPRVNRDKPKPTTDETNHKSD